MFIKDQKTMESYIHICDKFNGQYIKKLQEDVIVGRHDVSNYMILVQAKKIIHISTCPFCGTDLDADYIKSME